MNKSNFKFTVRDSALLVDLYKHRFLTISQLQRLHFPSMQTAYRRLRLLKEVGLAASFMVANISESIFTVDRKGLEAVAAALGTEVSDLRLTDIKSKPRDHFFMRHFLAINDFRIILKQACNREKVRLLGFIPDYQGERTERRGIAKYIRDVVCDITTERDQVSHTPDGVFALEKEGRTALFFLEIDRGTEIVSDNTKGVLKSLRFYTNYLIEGGYQRYAKDFRIGTLKGFRALYLTTSKTRLINIRKAAFGLQVPQKAKHFIWLALFQDITSGNLFLPVWRSIDPDDNKVYSIGGKS
ncbi:hypothetical protein TRIP_C50005 [Candidatus Zixiibacteriota bacterium]|nr:hypothetical protein TRIP_C50005 [candidate division Zixibacteria bacterium]